MTVMDLLKNNANHFGSYGSSLPTPVLQHVVTKEHESSGNTYGAFRDYMDSKIDSLDDSDASSPPRVSYPSASALASSPKKKRKIDYTNAEIAKMYGMSRSTAYQEALANTSYQRSVKDMQAAGLNPAVLFGAGRASPASSAVYASEASGFGGSGRGYARSRRSSGNDDKLFSSGVYNALSTIGGLIGIAVTKRPDGYWIGSSTTQGAMNALDALSKLDRK